MADRPPPPRGRITRAPEPTRSCAATEPPDEPEPPTAPPHLVGARPVAPAAVETPFAPAADDAAPTGRRVAARPAARRERRGLRFLGPGFGADTPAEPEPESDGLTIRDSRTGLQRRRPRATLGNDEVPPAASPDDPEGGQGNET